MTKIGWAVVAHAFNPDTWEAEEVGKNKQANQHWLPEPTRRGKHPRVSELQTRKKMATATDNVIT